MLEMLMQWYRRRFSDPEAIALLVILVAGFGIIFFFSGLLAPLLVAIVLAYLLEWPTVRLQSIGCSRRWATSIVLVVFVGILLLMAFVVLPIAWQQGIYLIRDMPGMLNKLSDFAATLPRRYPALMDAGIIDAMAENMRSRMLTMGDSRWGRCGGISGSTWGRRSSHWRKRTACAWSGTGCALRCGRPSPSAWGRRRCTGGPCWRWRTERRRQSRRVGENTWIFRRCGSRWRPIKKLLTVPPWRAIGRLPQRNTRNDNGTSGRFV